MKTTTTSLQSLALVMCLGGCGPIGNPAGSYSLVASRPVYKSLPVDLASNSVSGEACFNEGLFEPEAYKKAVIRALEKAPEAIGLALVEVDDKGMCVHVTGFPLTLK